jgi:hypothetical protein
MRSMLYVLLGMLMLGTIQGCYVAPYPAYYGPPAYRYHYHGHWSNGWYDRRGGRWGP